MKRTERQFTKIVGKWSQQKLVDKFALLRRTMHNDMDYVIDDVIFSE